MRQQLCVSAFVVVASVFVASSASAQFSDVYSDEYMVNLQVWKDFVSQNKWGSSEDYWLETLTPWGWEKVAVVMGYWNDWEACEEMKAFWQNTYAGADYRCIPANER
jgi:hypothetical protein